MAEKETQDGSSKKTIKNTTDLQSTIKATNSPQKSNPNTSKDCDCTSLNSSPAQNRSIVSCASSNQFTTNKSIIEPANKVCFKTTSPNLNNITSDVDSTSQLRSTLAIGQLIASNRPTAGSRLIAGELRQLTKTIAEESATLRKEISNLSISLSDSLKTIMDEDREQRSIASALYRRPMFAQLARKSFPMYHRRRRGLGFSMKQGSTQTDIGNASTGTPLSPRSPAGKGIANKNSSPGNANKRATTSKQVSPSHAQKLALLSEKAVNSAKALGALFKNGWFPPDRVFIATNESDTDTDSSDTNPSP